MGDRTDHIDVAYVARLARLELSAEETRRFQAQLDQIVDYVRQIREPVVDGVAPMSHAHPLHNVFRADAVRPGLDRETVLANAPRHANGQFAVPRIIE
jgi:aspartyl-tRNA(Asn)/glutamyl-tRNA(Gln) amidotransferase subunit C